MSHFPVPQPLPLVAPPPRALASAIHYASTFRRAPLVRLVFALPSASTPISLQLCLVPWPPPLVDLLLVTAFGSVCRCSRCCIRPLRRHLPQSKRPPNIAVSGVVAARIRPQRGASFAVAVVAGTIPRVRCQHGVSPAVACHACPSPGRGPEEGASPSQ